MSLSNILRIFFHRTGKLDKRVLYFKVFSTKKVLKTKRRVGNFFLQIMSLKIKKSVKQANKINLELLNIVEY